MVKCPFCHSDNEDGALFCDTCKSDLSGVGPAVPAIPLAIAEPLLAEPMPLMAEAVEVVAEPLPAEAIELVPVTAEPVFAEPVVLETVQPPVAPTPPPAPVVAAIPVTPSRPPEPPTSPVSAAVPVMATPTPAPAAAVLPAGAQPRLLVQRGLKRNVEYPIYEGLNFIGRADDKPVDIDLEDQEPPDRVWCSRQHACISFENDRIEIEDLNSANGTYVNRARIYPGQKRPLSPNDVVQIGNVQLRVVV